MARQRTGRQAKPATSSEERELQLANAAFDLAEEQILNGTASSQVITAAMKFGSTRERLEQERMQHEVELMKARKDQIEGQKRVEELFGRALEAMRDYSGQTQRSVDADYLEER